MSKKLSCTAENEPLTIDAITGRFDPPPPTIHLKTADDVRLEMAKVYREMRGNRMDIADGCKLVYVLGQLGKIIETSEVQMRIEAVERILNRRK